MAKAASQIEKLGRNAELTEAQKAKQRIVLMKRVKKKVTSIERILIFPSVGASAQRYVDRLSEEALDKLLRGCIDLAQIRRRRGICSADVTYMANALGMPGSFDDSVPDELSMLPNCTLNRVSRSSKAKGGVKVPEKETDQTTAGAEEQPDLAVTSMAANSTGQRDDEGDDEQGKDDDSGSADPDATDDE